MLSAEKKEIKKNRPTAREWDAASLINKSREKQKKNTTKNCSTRANLMKIDNICYKTTQRNNTE